ncbi:MAG: [FeFe] hydrogenase H-cluster radical SAM maturase HydE [Sedimentisphaerales bacterium]|nr:[FeFe] hydrogenase H-cluster radical SAM maturase HydE [Sedimentisphaerales bacterium]
MVASRMQAVLERIYAAEMPDLADIEEVLRTTDPDDIDLLVDYADRVRRDYVGDGVLLRGIIEFSNCCHNTCKYCGLNRSNATLQRYRLTHEQILAATRNIWRAGVKTVVLQSGEEDNLDAGWLWRVIEEIKTESDLAVTLSVGERRRQEYELWKKAGADRYLLKIETSDPGLYRELHPGMSFENRMRCLQDLIELGYQTGSGNIVGLRGQTIRSLAGDVRFFKQGDFDMISVSPFIPHPQTALAGEPAGDLTMTLKMTALARIVSRNAHIPATTAIGSLNGRDERPRALAAGADVLMPNFTPVPYRPYYEIYPNKRCASEDVQACTGCMEQMAAAIGRRVDYSRGDSLKDVGCALHTFSSDNCMKEK